MKLCPLTIYMYIIVSVIYIYIYPPDTKATELSFFFYIRTRIQLGQ